MAPTLGKRKRVTRAELEQPSRSPSPSSDASDAGEEDLQAIFQRAFEAKFKPLPAEPKKPKIEKVEVEEDDGADEEESDWSGISDAEEDSVQVIEYKDARRTRDDDAERAEMKAFMSSKPPTSAAAAPSKSTSSKKKSDDADLTESTNLKNDLALQKLLRESHLLSASSSGTSTPTLTATGIARHKSTDLHLQSLGAKSSVFTQKNMPMAQRKHMVQKARLTEEKRRAEAKEAGIVLEREQRVAKKAPEKRERGIGGPSIGKFKGGTLSLSKKDVRSITGGGGAKGKGKGKKGKR
jgi:hypothetical protein